MLRRDQSLYEPGYRSDSMLKLKARKLFSNVKQYYVSISNAIMDLQRSKRSLNRFPLVIFIRYLASSKLLLFELIEIWFKACLEFALC
jgi:hypothetical protein